MITKKLKKEILDYAATKPDEEVCGVVLREGRALVFSPEENVAEDTTCTFALDPSVFIKHGDKVVAIVHSHPNGDKFLSGADRKYQVSTGLTWLLAAGGEVYEYEHFAHLLGRDFIYHKHDCAKLVLDAYKLCGFTYQEPEKHGVREDSDGGMILKHIASCGFEQVRTPVEGDVILMSVGGEGNHMMLYLGDGVMLHHAFGQRSRREDLTESWKNMIHSVWRHEKFEPEMFRAIENDLENSGWSY